MGAASPSVQVGGAPEFGAPSSVTARVRPETLEGSLIPLRLARQKMAAR
jgi:hypothetical protein